MHEREQDTADLVDLAIRLGVLGLLIYWSFVLVQPFLVVVLWSVMLAVAVYPTYEWLAAWIGGRRRLAAALITILGLLITLGPVTWLGLGLVDNIHDLYERIAAGEASLPPPPAMIKSVPFVGDQIHQLWTLASVNLKAALVNVAPQLKPYGSTLLGAAGSVGMAILGFIASVIITGLLLIQAPALVGGAKAIARRINETRGESFIELAGATIRSVSRGVIGIALLQALLAGVGFIVAGIPAAGLLAFAVLVLAIVQIGGAIVILATIVWSWMTMETSAALLFTAYMMPVNLIDNILRPIVLGRGLKTPMLVILIGVVGGTLAHGIIGLFVGPIVLAVFWELLSAWVEIRSASADRQA
jgi:predicted PurR-regulated permease PerM